MPGLHRAPVPDGSKSLRRDVFLAATQCIPLRWHRVCGVILRHEPATPFLGPSARRSS